MKKNKTCIIILIFIILFVNLNQCHAISKYDISFNIKKNIYDDNFKSQYKEIILNNLAPGIKGKLNIKIFNSMQDINYILKFYNEENKPFNMKFYYKDKQYNSLSALNNFLSGDLKQNEEKNIEIEYVWNYETGESENEIGKNDEIDIQDNNKLYKFDIELVAEEIQNEIIKFSKNPKTGDNIREYILLLSFSIIFLIVILILILIYKK